MKWYISTRAKLLIALSAFSLVSVLLYLLGVLRNGSWDWWYLNWNLFLAWIPLLVMLWLERVLNRKLWSSWQALLLTLLFIIFLPNAFYLMTDIIHLQESTRVDLIYDVAMFNSFIFTGCILGFLSLFLLHAELRKRLHARTSWLLVSGTILLTSFAIYIGRDLRWNTWDVLLNPASILFEVSERLLHPRSHPEVVSTTLSFFGLIGAAYVVAWFAARLARQQKALD